MPVNLNHPEIRYASAAQKKLEKDHMTTFFGRITVGLAGNIAKNIFQVRDYEALLRNVLSVEDLNVYHGAKWRLREFHKDWPYVNGVLRELEREPKFKKTMERYRYFPTWDVPDTPETDPSKTEETKGGIIKG